MNILGYQCKDSNDGASGKVPEWITQGGHILRSIASLKCRTNDMNMNRWFYYNTTETDENSPIPQILSACPVTNASLCTQFPYLTLSGTISVKPTVIIWASISNPAMVMAGGNVTLDISRWESRMARN